MSQASLMPTILMRVATILFFAYLGINLYLYFFQRSLLFYPVKELHSTPKSIGLAYEDVFIKSGSKRIHGWYVPNEKNKFVVLFFHGNAGNISDRLDTIRIMSKLGLSTLIIDYQGFGLSEGKPSESGINSDAMSAWKYLCKERNITTNQIIVAGRSLGGAVASYVAANVNPKALIIESAFTSIPHLAKRYYPYIPTHWIARDKFPTQKYVQDVKCPILIIHSREDELIPFAHGKLLAQTPNKNITFEAITGSHNNGFIESYDTYTRTLEMFIDTIDAEKK